MADDEPITGRQVAKAISRPMRRGRWDDAEAEIEKLRARPHTDEAAETMDYHLVLIATYRGDHAERVRRLTAAAEAHPNSARLGYELGVEHLEAGRPAEAFALFDRCITGAGGGRAQTAARFAYVFNEPERGLRYLEPIFEAYRKSKIADDHYNHAGGLPFVGTAVRTALAFHWMLGHPERTLDLIDELAADLSDMNAAGVRLLASYHARGEREALVEMLDARLAEAQPDIVPCGVELMQRAAVTLDTHDDPDDALRAVEAVALTGNDHPWLESVRQLLLAKLHAAAGRKVEEEACVARFLEKQPMLLEPELAVMFDVLAYQETLKPRVRRG